MMCYKIFLLNGCVMMMSTYLQNHTNNVQNDVKDTRAHVFIMRFTHAAIRSICICLCFYELWNLMRNVSLSSQMSTTQIKNTLESNMISLIKEEKNMINSLIDGKASSLLQPKETLKISSSFSSNTTIAANPDIFNANAGTIAAAPSRVNITSTVSTSTINNSENNVTSSNLSKINIRNSEWKYQFYWGTRSCFARLGFCIGMGCDGVAWLATALCDDGRVHDIVLKFIKNETDILESNSLMRNSLIKRLGLDSSSSNFLSNHLAIPLTSINITVGDLSTRTGKCHVVNYTKGSQCPGKLPDYIWRDPNKIVNADVMLLAGENYMTARNNPIYKKDILNIILGLAQGLSSLYQGRILHCDLKAQHATVTRTSPSPSSSSSTLTTMITDFGRIVFCDTEKCSIGFQLQMFQFGTLILEFCRSNRTIDLNYAGAEYAFNNGPCGWGILGAKIKTQIFEIYEKEWKNHLFEIVEKPFNCPYEETLKKIILSAYSSILLNKIPNWPEIIQELTNKIQNVQQEQQKQQEQQEQKQQEQQNRSS